MNRVDRYEGIVMDILLKAWSEDRGGGIARPKDYDKKAWIYVQSKLERYFREQAKKSANAN